MELIAPEHLNIPETAPETVGRQTGRGLPDLPGIGSTRLGPLKMSNWGCGSRLALVVQTLLPLPWPRNGQRPRGWPHRAGCGW